MKFKDYDMEIISNDLLKEIASARNPPCVSLFQVTHRQHPDNVQDPLRFRVLIKEVEASLRKKYSSEETQNILNPFHELAIDSQFWNHTLDGLVVFACQNYFRAVRIPRSVSEFVIVSDSFHTKPIHRFLQSVDRYQVLGISLNQIRLFEGNRYSLDEIELVPGVPRTISEALGNELTEPHTTVASYGGVGGGATPMHHGHGGKKDEVNIDAERFFRAVDRAILEHYSQQSRLPLILAALPQHHHLFRRISHNPHLISEGISFNPDSISVSKLQNLAWQAIEPVYKAKLNAWNEEFAKAKSQQTGSDDLVQVAQATASGRVKTLLIEAERQIAGRLNATTGKVELDDLRNPEVDDLLDDLGELVEKMKGLVHVVPADKMPTRTGLAAIYRY